MGFRDRLLENLYKLRIIPNTTSADVTTFAKEGQTLPDKVESAIENGQRIDLSDISKITNLKVNRNEKYTIFEDMVTDGRIGAGVEMYANDTVQPNQEGRILWVESEDPDVVKYVENLLSDLNIEQNMWTYAYRMYLYGDVYLETFKSSSNDNSKPNLLLARVNGNASNVTIQKPLIGQNIERYIELVPNPANIYDLQYKGKTSGYARGDDDLSVVNSDLNMSGTFFYSNENHTIDLLGPTKFVHICLSPNINRFPEKFKLIKDDKKNNIWNNDNLIDGSEKEGNTNGALTFNVKSGQSILENVYAPYQTLKLKEDSILLERITKSSITRIVQIELGDMPENQKRLKLQELKNQIEQQMILNKDNGTVQSRPGGQPIENIVYTTTNNGKGVISSVNIGGDVDIGNTDDIESSENKVYGSLLIPKGLLGANMEGSGLSNGGSLTEMNTTYARRIKRGQQALISGFTDLVNIFALAEGVGDKVVNNYTIRITPIITIEDIRRDELLGTKINNVRDILNLFDNVKDTVDDQTKLELLLNWLGSYLSQSDAVDIINNTKEESTSNEDTLDDTKSDDKEDKSKSNRVDVRHHISSDNMKDEEIPIITREPNLETPEQVNLNDIEGEDLL